MCLSELLQVLLQEDMCEVQSLMSNINSKSDAITILVFNNLTNAISLIHLARLITFRSSSHRGAVKADLWNVVSLGFCIESM